VSDNPSAADLRLLGQDGLVVGAFRISQLPTRVAPIQDRSLDPDRVASAPSIELREAAIYRYAVSVPGKVVSLEPRELLDPDDVSLLTGRLNTGEAVGEVALSVVYDSPTGHRGGQARVEVRPAKLTDEAAFRSMLSDLAEISVEVLHQGFAPSGGRFVTDAGASPRLLYQQFALLNARLFATEMEWALARILAEPYRSWETEVEERPLGTPIKSSSRLARSLTRGGHRVSAPSRVPIRTLPLRLSVDRTESTLDNVPNRYVRFVLERWRSIAHDALAAVEGHLRGATLRRGRAQAHRTVDRLDELLAHPVFRESGILRSFPQGNQVLIKRDGYRQVMATAALIESSLGLELDIEDPFIVSRRSVATLYEYWCFVRLAEAVGSACGERHTYDLFRITDHGMSLALKHGMASRLQFAPVISGRQLSVDLFFNRTFGAQSWTRQMRPDASLLIRPVAFSPSGAPGLESWLHFDAKYRVDWTDPFPSDPDFEDDTAERVGESKRTDLLKMHAYRDAIRDSAAAYVLFPGDQPREFRYATEALPALGAFPLRPDVADADCRGLEQFVSRVLAHVANQATRHERARFWEKTAYAGPGASKPVPVAPFLHRPPADTPVLLGYIKDAEHLAWIHETGMYNVRADDRRGALAPNAPALDARLLVLYGGSSIGEPPLLFTRITSWSAADRGAMLESRYPRPRGRAYLRCEIETVIPQPAWFGSLSPGSLRPAGLPAGAPFAVTWLDLTLAAQEGL
jgi:hypothetical protein